MVNASLNWASIVGIVLAVGGAMLYFMRSFKPALARDYDVFFAAIGLLCGGILFFQGWRLDPILQFGQFLLAGTTVFFAYESVRLRGISAEQARRSAYFDDEPEAASPAGGLRGGYDDPYDRFDEPQPIRRRFGGQGLDDEERPEQDFYRPRRTSRAAIPEQAASRSRQRPDPSPDWSESSERDRRMARFGRSEDSAPSGPSFGDRRNQRQDQRRGSRPTPVASSRPEPSSRASAGGAGPNQRGAASAPMRGSRGLEGQPGIPQGSPLRREPEDAAYSPSTRQPSSSSPFISRNPGPEEGPTTTRDSNRTPPRSSRPRDNSSRFDD